jgi:hypothetical protein
MWAGLDRDSEGLMLVTNDGDLALALTHPRFKIEKEYEVRLDRPFDPAHREKAAARILDSRRARQGRACRNRECAIAAAGLAAGHQAADSPDALRMRLRSGESLPHTDRKIAYRTAAAWRMAPAHRSRTAGASGREAAVVPELAQGRPFTRSVSPTKSDLPRPIQPSSFARMGFDLSWFLSSVDVGQDPMSNCLRSVTAPFKFSENGLKACTLVS